MLVVRRCWLTSLSSSRSFVTSSAVRHPRQGSRAALQKLLRNNVEQEKQIEAEHTIPQTPQSHSESRTVTENLGEKNDNDALNKRRDQSRHSWRPRVDPADTSIILFPGQGAQFVGMGKDLLQFPEVPLLFEQASDVLGYDLLELTLEGPLDKLSRTEYLQPAMLVTSLAAVEKLKSLQPEAITKCVGTAGFSVGEYAALVFSGTMKFQDAVSVVQQRGRSMQQASEETPSGMMTVFLGPSSKLNLACHTARQYCLKHLKMEDGICSIANFLYPDCKVIAGNKEALEFIEINRRDFDIKRVKQLPVSGAFHTPLMKPAAQTLQKVLEPINLSSPLIPVYSNVTSHRFRGSQKHMKDLLVQQVTKPVKWEQTMHVIYSRTQGRDFPFTFEMGPGSQLGAILKNVNRPARAQYSNVSV